jgi:hypothetical protein
MMRPDLDKAIERLADEERRYVLIERLGILCGKADPTPAQLAIAQECAERAYRNVLNAHRQLEFQVEGRAA